MIIRIPASEFYQLTDNPDDRATELVVDMKDEVIVMRAGPALLNLTREQVEQLNQYFSDWLDSDQRSRWSDFWTLALK